MQKVSFDNEGVKNHFIIVLLNGPFMFAWFHIHFTNRRPFDYLSRCTAIKVEAL